VTHIILQDQDVERRFSAMAALFISEMDEPSSEESLREEYSRDKDIILHLKGAEDPAGRMLGFTWVTRSRLSPQRAYLYLIVPPEFRRQGVGSLLLQDAEQTVRAAGVQEFEATVLDDCLEGLAFLRARDFVEKYHQLGMSLDLNDFDKADYDALIARLKTDGFVFTSMEALGNTEDAQRKLFVLNDTTSSQTVGASGEHAWDSFEDFQSKVCSADWYIPAGQMVAIDSMTGNWAAMSAITRFTGKDYAYNLFTGVDERYRGRRLGTAVKVLALRYARDVLKAKKVRTHHNAANEPMLAIDRLLGYTLRRGYYTMQKRFSFT